MISSTFKPVQILLVEDNPGDVALSREALTSSKLAIDLVVENDGLSALRRLEACKDEGSLPDLILLDLNLPGLSGMEILKRIKHSPSWMRIPVIILTSSEAESDILKSYESHANCYISKPIDFQQFIGVVQTLEEFWFTMVRLPGEKK